MTRRQRDRQIEFLSLCFSLTMQGFHFTKDNNGFLEMDWVEVRRLGNPYTRLPFVQSWGIHRLRENKFIISFKLRSDVTC